MSITTFEHLSLELFYEIFSYFQLHETLNSFSKLNTRFTTAIVNNMLFVPVYLGLNGMSIALTEFYYKHLSQSNVCNRLISLCISHKLAFDNGFWLASHASTFISLRHLSLIDIKRSSFESILNSFPVNIHLIMFGVRFSTYDRAAYTFEGVPEGAYYEQIFRLFPFLHLCHLAFWRYINNTLDNQIVLPLDKVFIPIQTTLLYLQSITIYDCSLAFLSHLLKRLPQLQELSFCLSRLWISDKHPLINDKNTAIPSISKRLLPNLRQLKITWNDNIHSMDLLIQLFDHALFCSLRNFTLLGLVSGSNVICKLLSMLDDECSYILQVRWNVKTLISLSDTSAILLDTFRQLKGRVPIELTLFLYYNSYCIEGSTVPQIEKSLCMHNYFNENTVYGHSRWACTMPVSNNHLVFLNEIVIDYRYLEMNGEYYSYLLNIISWHQITSLMIDDPLDLYQLRLLISKMINLRVLKLSYHFNYNSDADSNKKKLINFLNDTFLCNMLMSHGLQKISFYMDWGYPDMINLASLIVKRLPYLQIIELNCQDSHDIQLPQALNILINGLPKLNFLIVHGSLAGGNEQYSKMNDLQKNSTRAYRMQSYNPLTFDVPMLYVWL